MKIQSKDEIITELENYLEGNDPANWSIGITEDVQKTLFEENEISRRWDDWVIKTAPSVKIAEEIKEYFLDKGFNSCIESRNSNSLFIFIFKRLNPNRMRRST